MEILKLILQFSLPSMEFMAMETFYEMANLKHLLRNE